MNNNRPNTRNNRKNNGEKTMENIFRNASVKENNYSMKDLELAFNDVSDRKIIKRYCDPLNLHFEDKDIKLMLDVAGVKYPKDATKDELCKMLTKSIPRRILEGIITYGAQVGKGSAVSVVLVLLISSLFTGAALMSPIGQAAAIAPIIYGVGSGIYKGVRHIAGLDHKTYFKIKDAFKPKKKKSEK